MEKLNGRYRLASEWGKDAAEAEMAALLATGACQTIIDGFKGRFFVERAQYSEDDDPGGGLWEVYVEIPGTMEDWFYAGHWIVGLLSIRIYKLKRTDDSEKWSAIKRLAEALDINIEPTMAKEATMAEEAARFAEAETRREAERKRNVWKTMKSKRRAA